MIRFKPRSIPSMPRAADQMVATVVTESRAAGDTVWMSWITDSISGWMLEEEAVSLRASDPPG
ncbi:MAG: hypothetical protein ACLR8P_12155 [Clostridium fessum]